MIKPGSPASLSNASGHSSGASPLQDNSYNPEVSNGASFSFNDITCSLDLSDAPSKSVSRVLGFESDEASSFNLQSSQVSLPLFYSTYVRHSKQRNFADEIVNSQDQVRVSQLSMHSIGSVIDFAKVKGHHRKRSSLRSSQDLKSSFNISATSNAMRSSLTSDLTYSPDVSQTKQGQLPLIEENSAAASVSDKSCTFDAQPFAFENRTRSSVSVVDSTLGCHPAKTYCPQCDKVVLTDVTMQLPEVDL
jgi:hypothetical protein